MTKFLLGILIGLIIGIAQNKVWIVWHYHPGTNYDYSCLVVRNNKGGLDEIKCF